MNLSIGIVGLPNVGKSTLFNALVKTAQAKVSDYPFCTIEPNMGVVEVPDGRLNQIAEKLSSSKTIPATIKFIDIAGLVKNAHKGEGLGNQFLSHIAECDAVAVVLRAFEDEKIAHISGKIDPIADREIIKTELILKDLKNLGRTIESTQKQAKSGDKLAIEFLAVLKKLEKNLNEGKLAIEAGLSEEEKKLIRSLNLLTLKPMMFILNVSENQLKNPPYADLPTDRTVTVAAKTEAALSDLSEKEKLEYLIELGLQKSAIGRIIEVGYKLLDLITFYTLKSDQVQAWPIKKNSTAIQAAAIIHSDFAKRFIKAEVIAFQDLIKAGSIAAAQEKGLIRFEGKEYKVEDGDIIKFKI